MGKNGNTSNQTNPFYRAFQILLLIGIVLLLVYIIKLLLDYKPVPPPPPLPSASPIIPSATPTLTPTSTPTSTPPPTSTFTPAPPVTPTDYVPVPGPIGTNLPPDFVVGPWHDDTPVCDKFARQRPVNITGVTISGGTAPYEIIFMEYYTRKPIDRITTRQAGRTDFETAISLKRGEYIHVVITFGDSRWEDDLKYLTDYAQCDSKE